MATITGRTPQVRRIITGMYSFDRAFRNDEGDIGVPIGVGYEIFGVTGVGKSTFSWSLAGLLGKELGKNIAIADLEGFNTSSLQRVLEWSKFTGECHIVEDTLAGKRTEKSMDESMMDNLIRYMHNDDYAIGVVDSVAAISPIAEQEGAIGEANMGRRAKIVAQFCRKFLPLTRSDNSDKTLFMINHWYPKLGSQGYNTPAGEVMKYLTTVRVLLSRTKSDKTKNFPDGSYVLDGLVYKNRWGFERIPFQLFVLVGRGLHAGLCCMYDAVTAKKAERTKSGHIKIGDENFGRISDLVRAAKNGENEVFTSFREVLDGTIEDTDSVDVSDELTNNGPED